jgi:hypothetical protein
MEILPVIIAAAAAFAILLVALGSPAARPSIPSRPG